MLADSHCHILDPRLCERAENIVKNLKDDGINFIVEISASPQESKDALAFAVKHNNVFCTIGVHPYYASEYSEEFDIWAARVAASDVSCLKHPSSIVAVGECGLDYHYENGPDKKLQQEVFVRQIILADKLKLPLVVHTREAFDDTLQILVNNKKHIKNGLLFHCFSHGADEVRKVCEHFDTYFAFGGAVTYKNNKTSSDAIHAVPLNRLLLETDAPYLAPEPLRGKTNEPKYIKKVAEFVSRCLNLPIEEIEQKTLKNTEAFYRVKNLK